ncbi:hypothetical protein FE374_14220 [Georgenia yuyongxinii]|uniref:Uncharacterized protein n=1 Tax=Georgenia yuyongxinii TaxID=2589797 RepID=A0A5B8CBQ9_9MICO|nr:hypothetical protein [Georgenia yuyongxinii]QDC25606.1 hypothetical protein FE374_14220 [Georgenia yuyongxinii]
MTLSKRSSQVRQVLTAGVVAVLAMVGLASAAAAAPDGDPPKWSGVSVDQKRHANGSTSVTVSIQISDASGFDTPSIFLWELPEKKAMVSFGAQSVHDEMVIGGVVVQATF